MTAQENPVTETIEEIVEDAPSKKKFSVPPIVKKVAIYAGAGLALVGVTVLATLAASSPEESDEDLYELEPLDDTIVVLETPAVD